MDSPRSETPAGPAPSLPQWFAREVHPHDAHLRAYLRGAFPAVRDVDDVVQKSYLRIWRVGRERASTPACARLLQPAH